MILMCVCDETVLDWPLPGREAAAPERAAAVAAAV